MLLKKNKIFAIGRRKTARAQVQLMTGTGQFIINGKTAVMYMQEDPSALLAIQAPIQLLRLYNDSDSTLAMTSSIENSTEEKIYDTTKYDTVVKVNGGGLKGQAEAIKLGIAKALCIIDESYRSCLRTKGYLTRDSRSKERKKYGLKKARKAPQFSKR
uniref:Small ribosomal subunit protein uS9c n=1 Tax=Microthamnion kuetzingianum TaxID=34148 RepID=A0A097KNF4_9CHLO|nr:ribosomal protein S9 [Microthamnion kuetzingianum]AIT94729.1 ribosomal protein S9 [Microthamnion kuetzingianum]